MNLTCSIIWKEQSQFSLGLHSPSVYYKYLIVNLAGLTGDSILLMSIEQHINSDENNHGRMNQSLVQASCQTWEDGPSGNQGENKGKTISNYGKGPIIGLLPDFTKKKLYN